MCTHWSLKSKSQYSSRQLRNWGAVERERRHVKNATTYVYNADQDTDTDDDSVNAGQSSLRTIGEKCFRNINLQIEANINFK
jgi:hypothetical protein